MNFQELPTDKDSIVALAWHDLEPYYKELSSRPLTEESIQAWLNDWSRPGRDHRRAVLAS